jgi:hypothetical protein
MGLPQKRHACAREFHAEGVKLARLELQLARTGIML